MPTTERRVRILDLIREEGSAKVSALSALFKVSEPTIRQDLEELEREGYVIREHGGAFLRSLSQQVRSLSLQHEENPEKKRAVAKRAVEFVHNGDFIIVDSGSTATAMARLLHGFSGLTVLTNALNVALDLGSVHGISVYVTGGEFKAPTLSLSGETAARFFDGIQVESLFLAAGGVSDDLEVYYPGFQDLPVKRAMMAATKKSYLIVDSTKFGRTSLVSLGSISMVDAVITNADIPPSLVERISSLGVEVILAES